MSWGIGQVALCFRGEMFSGIASVEPDQSTASLIGRIDVSQIRPQLDVASRPKNSLRAARHAA
jgi:hypothetical protein